MNVRWMILVTLAWIGLHSTALAQGFAGLGTSEEGFAKPERGTVFQFPKDHGPHHQFRIEWWYLTANLKGEDGADYGVQWTLFRSASKPGDNGSNKGWNTPQLWMAHAGLTSKDHHFSAERRARGGTGQAGVKAQPFSAWIDNWEMSAQPTATLSNALPSLSVKANGEAFSYALKLESGSPLVLHGDKGFSVKAGGGQASYYYSQPFYKVSGAITLNGEDVKVSGQAWLDREWSSQPLAEDQKGWDWVSLHFDDGAKLMGFAVRKADGTQFTSATWIAADGTVKTYENGALQLTPLERTKTGTASLPTTWRVQLSAESVDVEVNALNPNAWMETSIAYWEGPVRITGSHKGNGYLEMTGYER